MASQKGPEITKTILKKNQVGGHGQLIFYKGVKSTQWRKDSVFNWESAGKTGKTEFPQAEE